MARIFLSSTFSDLQNYREAAYRALRLLRHDVVAMEDYVATDLRPIEKCLLDVAQADLYVGIIAWRYGYIPSEGNPNSLSITEIEYRKAKEIGIPCLIFLLNKEAPWPPKYMDQLSGSSETGARVDAFRRALMSNHLVSFFQNPDELARLVTYSVVRALDDLREPTGRRLSVFLCHASEDKQDVRELYCRLSADGFDPWLDEEKLLPGQDWRREITSALHKADVVLVCLSRTSVTKTGFIQKEIRDILDLADLQPEGTIFLIPTKLEECGVPERLAKWHWVDYFSQNGYQRLQLSLKERAKGIAFRSPNQPLAPDGNSATLHSRR